MEDSISVSSGNGGTGGATSSPQNTGQLSSDSQNPQTSVNGATINYEASNNSIPLEPTNQLTASVTKTPASLSHPVDMVAIIPIVFLVLAAVILSLYFYKTSKRKPKYE